MLKPGDYVCKRTKHGELLHGIVKKVYPYTLPPFGRIHEQGIPSIIVQILENEYIHYNEDQDEEFLEGWEPSTKEEYETAKLKLTIRK